ncbi:MAG: hypothetical protein ABI467_27955 [Kofleriaceae bacterium]
MTMMPGRKMFKVLCPMESHSGHKFWMRMGSAFTNKDHSINLYLDAIPTKFTTLQLREVTEEDLRVASERRAAFTPRNSNAAATAGDHVASRHGDVGAGAGAYPGAAPAAPELDFPHPADSFSTNHVPF